VSVNEKELGSVHALRSTFTHPKTIFKSLSAESECHPMVRNASIDWRGGARVPIAWTLT